MLAEQAAHLAVGRLPDLIKGVGGKGRTTSGPGEISDIRWAVTYVYAVRKGQVRGLKPPSSFGAAASRRQRLLPLPLCVGCTTSVMSKLCMRGAEHTSLFRIQKRGPCRLSGTVWQTQLAVIAGVCEPKMHEHGRIESGGRKRV